MTKEIKPKKTYNEFRSVIETQMKKRDLSQQKIGEILGKDQAAISRILNLKQDLRIEDAVVLSIWFRVDLTDICSAYVRAKQCA